MVTKVPKTKVFGGTRYRLSTVPGSGNTEDEAKSLAREWRVSGRCARAVKFDTTPTGRKSRKTLYVGGRKLHEEWHVYVR